MKTCSRCGFTCNNDVIEEFFYRKANALGGFTSECMECGSRDMKLQRADLKKEVIDRYGGVCSCCGISELVFLTIDHVDGSGAKHRREVTGKGGHHFYFWLRRNNWPSGFQVLCWNCNIAKHLLGTCPHRQ